MRLSELLDIIDAAIVEFQKEIPGVQDRVFDELQDQVHLLKTKNGRILSSVENLKIIGNIGNRLESIILDTDYIAAVEKFITAFEAVEVFQNEYFSSFSQKFKPGPVLRIVKDLTVEATVNSLTEAGIGAGIIEPIKDILRTNITTGGSIADLNNMLREAITRTGTEGSLEKYSKQITTDAINQFSAQYNQTVAKDLGLEWFMYVGSNLETTRPWCEALTAKKYVHVSELPRIIEGWFGDQRVPIYKKTGLPEGMIPGTNVNNVTIYRGGYNCGHQLLAVDEVAVPEDVKSALFKTPEYKAWKKTHKQAA